MADTQDRVAYPLTFLLKKEGDGWASLACEVDVASCGDTLDEAREMLKEAVEVSVSSLVEIGKFAEIERPASPELLASFLNVAPEDLVIEYHTLLIAIESDPRPAVTSMEFVPTAVKPGCCKLSVAA